MSEALEPELPAPRPPAPVKPKPATGIPARIFLVSYPKIVFMYPTLLVAVAAAVYLGFLNQPLEPANTHAVVLAVIFLGVLATNMMVLAFDFPRATSLTLFFILVALALACVLLAVLQPGIFPYVTSTLRAFRPLANDTFYWTVAVILGLITLVAIIVARFDYWEARPNELLHRRGLWGDLDRFPAPGLRIDKEIGDVFEYLLLQSGRLVLHVSGERRAVVLDNVPFIDKKEEALTQMLGTLQVEVRSDTASG